MPKKKKKEKEKNEEEWTPYTKTNTRFENLLDEESYTEMGEATDTSVNPTIQIKPHSNSTKVIKCKTSIY